MRFITGDELGNIKAYTKADSEQTTAFVCRDLHLEGNKAKTIQALTVFSQAQDQASIACAHADGSTSLHTFTESEDSNLLSEKKHKWFEPRFKPGQRYVGMSITERGVYSCTSNGALSLTDVREETLQHTTTALPTRLCNWRLGQNEQTFTYGGDEVELSLWDTERAFSQQKPDPSISQKRKRGTDLLPAEVWRAKNIPNDSLSLRQPVHVTSLTFLSSPSSSPTNHLLIGTEHGHIRRYDTRAARRPVADWRSVAKVGGIKVVERGFAEHEAFISDHGSNLFALDTRTGRVLYGYQGIAGAITSLAPSPAGLASTSLDRFFRFHSTVSPATQCDQKGQVLEKTYTKSTATVVAWDPTHQENTPKLVDEDQEDPDQVWEGMQDVEDSDGEPETKREKRTRRTR